MLAWQKLMRYFYKKGKTQQVNMGKNWGCKGHPVFPEFLKVQMRE